MCPAYNYSLASLVAKGHKETMRSLGCSAVVCGDCRSYPEPRTDQLKLLNFVFSLFLFVNCGLTAEPTTEQVEFFETKVRPVLAERCYKCHSHQSEKLKGGLFLDSQEGLMKGGEAGPVITPGTLEKSKLIEAINYENPDLQMPPKGKLPKEQIAALTEWVKMGAPWPIEIKTNLGGSAAAKFDLEQRKRDHWAWQRIKPQPVPACQNSTWARAGPDRFILAKLEQHGLQPAPAAQPRSGFRRSSQRVRG